MEKGDQTSGGARARRLETHRNSGGVRSRRGSMTPDGAVLGAAAAGAHHQSTIEEQEGQKNSPAETSAPWRGSAADTAAIRSE